MLTPLAIFSAASGDKFEEYAQQTGVQPSHAAVRWKYEYRPGGEQEGWGLYFEKMAPNIAFSNHSQETTSEEEQEQESGDKLEVVEREGKRVVVRSPSGSRYSHVLIPSRRIAMAPKTNYTHYWISAWFAITIPVIFWDAGYCLLRPRSMLGGDLHWLWTPYAIYQEIDYVYGVKALQDGDGFPSAQSVMNIFENIMNIAYLYLTHVTGSPIAPLIGFTSVTMTLWKTILYWAQEYYCNGCSVGHNTLSDLIVYWVIPNGLWLVFPSLIMWRLGKDIAGSLYVTAKLSSGKTAKKTQ